MAGEAGQGRGGRRKLKNERARDGAGGCDREREEVRVGNGRKGTVQ